MEYNAIIFLILAIAIVIIGTIYTRRRHTRLIEQKMYDLGGTVISSQVKLGLFNVGPFKLVGRHQTVYYIEYLVDGETKDCWVKFSTWGEPDWRL